MVRDLIDGRVGSSHKGTTRINVHVAGRQPYETIMKHLRRSLSSRAKLKDGAMLYCPAACMGNKLRRPNNHRAKTAVHHIDISYHIISITNYHKTLLSHTYNVTQSPPPLRGGGGEGLKTEIFHFGGGGHPPPHLEIFQLKISGL